MKIFFMSDMHGSAHYIEKALERFKRENADHIAILGDELYHGARNPLPEGYDTQKSAKLLNEYADKIIAVRGNCDSEIDEMVLDYPIMAVYNIIPYNGKRIFLSHGHVYNDENLPKLGKGDIFIHGHTHLPRIERRGEIYIINPGSVTFPKEGNPNSYGVLEDDVFRIKDLDGNIFKEERLKM